MRLERMPNIMLLEITAAILEFKPKERYIGKNFMPEGEGENANTEKRKEELNDAHRVWYRGKPAKGKG